MKSDGNEFRSRRHERSQEAQIKKYLESGRTLTPMEALTLFRSQRLSGRIFNLRHRDKMDIVTGRLNLPDGRRVAKYYLRSKGSEAPRSIWARLFGWFRGC